jgi:hypothetical protein
MGYFRDNPIFVFFWRVFLQQFISHKIYTGCAPHLIEIELEEL